MEKQLTDLWGTYGVLAIFAIMFIIDWIDNKKTIKDEKVKNYEEKKVERSIICSCYF